MARRKVLKITPILIMLNVLILLFILGFYVTRLVKYYIEENGNIGEEDTTVLLADEVLKKQSMLDDTKGLVYDEKNNIYRYKGEVDDNYLLYSGMLYRIAVIDNEGNLRAVSENNVTMLYSGLEKGFKDSYVNKWLNKSESDNSGKYESVLFNSDELLSYTYTCLDQIDDLTNITCDEKNNDYKVTLMSLYDYRMAGGKASYLNNGETYSLMNNDGKNENYYVTTDGEIAVATKNSRISQIRPVITISSDAVLLDGNGKIDSPYIIEKHDVKTLKDTYVNNIVKMGDKTFKVIELNDDKVKLVATDVLKEKVKETDKETKEEKEVEKEMLMNFGGSSSAYVTYGYSVGSYLNGTYLDSLELKDKVVESKWYIGKLSLNNLEYTGAYKDSVDADIGLLTIGDFYIQEKYNVLTLLRGMEASNMINVINKDGHIFADRISAKYYVRPAFYLDSSVNITSGSGTEKDPYVLGDNKDGEGKETESKENKEG